MTLETLEKQLQQLPKTADELAADVRADEKLYQVIRTRAAQRGARTVRRWIVSAAAVAAAAALILLCLPQGGQQSTLNIESVTAGDSGGAAPAPSTRADLPAGSVTLQNADDVPAFRNLWAGNSDSRFPMVLVNGVYYRLLSSPKQLKNSQLGAEIGTIAQYTTEMTGTGLCSNTVLSGETVWQVRGMGDSVVAARIDGQIRVFQQVTANGQGRVPASLSEAIAQGGVTEISLSGVGRVRDAATAQRLAGVLVSQAFCQGGGCARTGQVLHIAFSNGVTLQMYVQNDSVSSAGTWSCPAFFEQFRQAI